jgi:purine-nucleoside/S-methyl-5'-thioadenosine phosphorylase / adenosine deaminase
VSGAVLLPDWPGVRGVRALFTLRTGGASRSPYDSFNLAAHVGDEADAVAQNRDRLRREQALPGEPLWLEQVHGTRVVDADHARGEPQEPPGPRGDAAVSRQPGTVLAVLVADCLPVLLAARDGSAVAVAHAGWRGLSAGVLEATVASLAAHAPLQAWLGPAISAARFEVGAEVLAAFVAQDRAAGAAFTPNARGRWQCDLRALARARLAALGVESIHADLSCCYDEPQRFYSYRRDGATGRMAALIWRQTAPSGQPASRSAQ